MDNATTNLDESAVESFFGHVAGLMTGAVTTAMIVIGDELGLYAAMAESGSVTPTGLAKTTGTHERYIREWLSQQAAIGIAHYDPNDGTFALPAEHAAVLASEDSPVSLAGDALMPAALFRRTDELAEAFRTGCGVPWADHDEAIFRAAERHFGVLYRNSLVSEWIPALDGIEERLRAGAKVADVGTGYGTAPILMATNYPKSEFVGFDNHAASIEVARKRAADSGVADRVRFEVAEATDFSGGDYDLICFFDAFHDMGDPVSAGSHARNALAPGGSVMLVEPFALDDLAINLTDNPGAAMYYGASLICVSNALSQPVGLALGAQAGESRLTAVLAEAGYGRVSRIIDNPFNLVLEARE